MSKKHQGSPVPSSVSVKLPDAAPASAEIVSVEVMLEARLVKSGDETPFEMRSDIINGLKNFKTEVRERIPIEKSKMAKLSPYTSSHKTIIDSKAAQPVAPYLPLPALAAAPPTKGDAP